MIVLSKTDLRCQDCGDKVTAQEMSEDTCRMHKTKNGVLLCELCYEDFLEKNCYSEE